MCNTSGGISESTTKALSSILTVLHIHIFLSLNNTQKIIYLNTVIFSKPFLTIF